MWDKGEKSVKLGKHALAKKVEGFLLLATGEGGGLGRRSAPALEEKLTRNVGYSKKRDDRRNQRELLASRLAFTFRGKGRLGHFLEEKCGRGKRTVGRGPSGGGGR